MHIRVHQWLIPSLLSRLVLTLGAAALLAVALLAPWLHSPWVYALGHPICHQRPERCFHLAGLPMALCARCLGIYGGALLGLAAALRPRRRLFLAALALLLVDLLSEAIGLQGPWAIGRFLTGAFAGATASPILLRELARVFGTQAPSMMDQSAVAGGYR